MLQSFSVGNFLSFRNVQTLSLVPDSIKDLNENLHTPYFYNHEERLLKSVAIYGHNSFGKSNFIKAFKHFQNLIFTSFSKGQQTNSIDTIPFRLDTSMANLPTTFEILFLIKETKYRYRISFTSKEILEEELHYAELKVRENYLFKRKFQDFVISKTWNKESESKINSAVLFTKPHILFLSVLLSQEKIPRIYSISNWFLSNLIVPDDYLNELTKARTIYSDPIYKTLILKLIDKADLGFTTIFDKLENLSNSKMQLEKGLLNIWYDKEIKNFDLYTNHDLYSEGNRIGSIEFELQKDESAGSIKYFILICLLAYAIKNSQLIWIDELDARFDSSLLEMIVESFHDQEINPINSQMIFTTHNTVLLDKKMRRDQMYIVEKNNLGESRLEKMHSSKKPIRAGKSIEKEYRKGKMGGVSKKIINPSLFD